MTTLTQNPARNTPAAGMRPLNAPRMVVVEATRNGLPRAVATQGVMQPVRTIHDTWRVDDEWWREQPVSRRYYRIELRGGRRLTIYHDLEEDTWFAQNYSAPRLSRESLRAG